MKSFEMDEDEESGFDDPDFGDDIDEQDEESEDEEYE